MPIRWSALAVSETVDQMEKELNKIVKPFARIRSLAEEAKQIPNLPQYMEQYFSSVKYDVDGAIGCNMTHGRYKYRMDTIRQNIPQDALAKEKCKRPLLDLNKIDTISKGAK